MVLFGKPKARVYLRRKSLKIYNYALGAVGISLLVIGLSTYSENVEERNPSNFKTLLSEATQHFSYQRFLEYFQFKATAPELKQEDWLPLYLSMLRIAESIIK